jgi:hypothetical protein
MDLLSMAQSVPHALGALQLDDSTVSVLAMLLGIVGGWFLTGLHQQMKAKRVKVSRKHQPTLRKRD